MGAGIEPSASVRSLARLGVLSLAGYRAGPAPPALARRMEERAAEIRERWNGRTAADAAGPFGNPSSDSRRASVDEDTAALLWVVFAPRDYEADRLLDHLALSARLATELGICDRHDLPQLVPPG